MDTIFLFEKVLVLLCVIMSTIQQITGGLERRIAPLVPLCPEKKTLQMCPFGMPLRWIKHD